MKYPILFFLLIIIFSCDNQPPDGYYSDKSTNQFKIDTIPKKTIKSYQKNQFIK